VNVLGAGESHSANASEEKALGEKFTLVRKAMMRVVWKEFLVQQEKS